MLPAALPNECDQSRHPSGSHVTFQGSMHSAEAIAGEVSCICRESVLEGVFSNRRLEGLFVHWHPPRTLEASASAVGCSRSAGAVVANLPVNFRATITMRPLTASRSRDYPASRVG